MTIKSNCAPDNEAAIKTHSRTEPVDIFHIRVFSQFPIDCWCPVLDTTAIFLSGSEVHWHADASFGFYA